MESNTDHDARRAAAQGRSPDAPLTDRVNVEPPILHGMTESEATMIGLASLIAWVAVGAVVAVVVGLWQVILVTAVFGPTLTLWKASSYLAGLKRNRPDGYYWQALSLWLAKHGLAPQRFIRHAGYWSLGRDLPFSLQPPAAEGRA
jgi:conjugative transfer region protein (TIGR03750 family)